MTVNIQAQCAALSTAGICVYLNVLEELSDDRNDITTIHVVPGRIVFKGRPFQHHTRRPCWNRQRQKVSVPKRGRV
ncbi:hypothetical protein BU23DRAFT_559231 [Bimuria novae-zelandiae CBS 107.79]|uniref:Uncharacterized protein n=1 Tax=Bimuria novae-zelandiae CBS 107.79 TaxID=1447943 RepID=A0A6A5UUD6_9PLEO|nr:hypothetical protein BU23DRAFT_559231 [Bimuria novae-zelandiae CBS 107.79]